jgi:sec-independent protein translocase protein TatA
MPLNIGPLELVIILLIVIALFGAGRIAGVGSALGKSVREFREEARNEDEEGEEGEEGDEGDDDDAKKSTVAESSGSATKKKE